MSSPHTQTIFNNRIIVQVFVLSCESFFFCNFQISNAQRTVRPRPSGTFLIQRERPSKLFQLISPAIRLEIKWCLFNRTQILLEKKNFFKYNFRHSPPPPLPPLKKSPNTTIFDVITVSEFSKTQQT